METKQPKDAKQVEFTDALGRRYVPRVTVRVLDAFERRAGFGLFEAVFDALGDSQGSVEGVSADPRFLLKIGKRLFGNVGNIVYLLYESCRPPILPGAKQEQAQAFRVVGAGQGAKIEQASVSFEELTDAIGPAELSAAVAAAVSALLRFFPEMEAVINGKAGPGGPFGGFFAGMSSSLLPSQASNPGITP